MFVLPRSKSRSNISPLSRLRSIVKGHFVVYTIDEGRYEVPLSCLSNHVIKELLKMAEEEYGLAIDRPITVPCDSELMDYILSIVGKQTSSEVEALLVSMASGCCSRFSLLEQENNYGYQSLYIAST